MARACIIIFVGIPGSGKTSLIDSILKFYEHESDEHKVIVHVNFDKIIPTNVERILIEESKEKSLEILPWKKHRSYILNCIDCLILKYLNQTSPHENLNIKPDAPEALWENFRKNCRQSGSFQDGVGRLILLVDDNMYYSSMRYQYFQLARKYEIGFAEVFVQCPVEEAINRNNQRQPRVTNDVIVTMAAKLEPPDPRQQWEKHSVKINHEDSKKKAIDTVMELISEALSDPVKDVLSEQAVISAESRAVCSANIIHQADQILRQLVTQAIRQQQGDISKNDLQVLAKSVNSWRSVILSEMKEGLIMIPSDLQDVKDAAKDSTSPLFLFVKSLFDSHSKGIS